MLGYLCISSSLYIVPLCLVGGGKRRGTVTLCRDVTYLLLKVELEALAGFGDDFLADFLVDKIVVRKGIATRG